ncbi:MAG: SDR family oxidoreductase [Anaerolineae bacterium]|nr:SDR family oxidoreductase [Anaerolineae bacterium]
MPEKILVAGATGGVGRAVVSKLAERKMPVRVLARDAMMARELFSPTVEIVPADATKPDSLKGLFSDIYGVICTIGAKAPHGPDSPQHVDYEGVLHLVEAAKAAHIAHFVLVSSIGVTQPNHRLNQMFNNVLNWKLKGEDALRESGLVYTIVRPGGLGDVPGGKRALQFDQGDRMSGRISRADVAEICLRALNQPEARQVTFEVIETEGKPPDDAEWAALFGGLQKDA